MDTINVKCNNNYERKEDFEQHYAESEEELRNCNNCPYMNYINGIMTCSKFQ